ncbi:MAG: hypothetical protein ACR2M7_02915 [Bdellovibrionales bacterium]
MKTIKLIQMIIVSLFLASCGNNGVFNKNPVIAEVCEARSTLNDCVDKSTRIYVSYVKGVDLKECYKSYTNSVSSISSKYQVKYEEKINLNSDILTLEDASSNNDKNNTAKNENTNKSSDENTQPELKNFFQYEVTSVINYEDYDPNNLELTKAEQEMYDAITNSEELTDTEKQWKKRRLWAESKQKEASKMEISEVSEIKNLCKSKDPQVRESSFDFIHKNLKTNFVGKMQTVWNDLKGDWKKIFSDENADEVFTNVKKCLIEFNKEVSKAQSC